jgi:lincosamide nucleotidyltransferase B/F
VKDAARESIMTPDRLVAGLNAIAATLSAKPQALALLALGSCGAERERLDAFSDLDFFVIVEESAKQAFIENLDWLTTGSPIVFAHRNTRDGWKTLDQDGVYCEFAVFHPAELADIPFAEGEVVWAREGFNAGVLEPKSQDLFVDVPWHCHEAMTNILIGLKRYLRGEKLSARNMIAGDAATHVCKALAQGEQSDPFNPWRRLELMHPSAAREVEQALSHSFVPEIARALVATMRSRVDLPTPLLKEIDHHLRACDAG